MSGARIGRGLAGLAALLALNMAEAAVAQGSVPIVWQGTLPRMPAGNDELVINTQAGGQPRLMLRRRDAAAPPLPALPLNTDLLPLGTTASFGSDGRCAIAAEGTGYRLACRPGTSISGAVFSFPEYRLPQGAAFQLELRSAGSAGFTAEVTPLRADAEAPVPVPVHAGVERSGLALPSSNVQPQLVIIAPAQGGEFVLRSARLLASAQSARAQEASAWIWTSRNWREAPAQLIAAAKARNMARLFVGLDVVEGNIAHRVELGRFVAMARAAGIAVEAVEGDPRMVLPDGLAAATTRAQAFAAYQRGAPEAERLAGIQYDIEPYVLEGWGEEPAGYSGWAKAIAALSEAAGAKVDLVVPFWVHDAAGGRQFLGAVRPHIRSLTVMSYRTEAAVLTQIAEPLLAWGTAQGVTVRLALEAGPLPDETEEVFRAAPRGTLAVMPGVRPRAYLLAASGTMDGARMFERRERIVIQARRLSFLGREQAMRDLAAATGPIFSAWPSFGGFALHGLDWDGPPPR